MAKSSQKTEKDSIWKAIQLKVGVIGLIIGLIITCYNFIIKATEKPPVNSDLQADLEVSYICIRSDIYSIAGSDSVKRTKQNYYLDFPIAPNEIAGKELIPGSSMVSDSLSGMGYVICLMIQNKGKSDAKNIDIDFKRLHINRILNIATKEGKPIDYEKQILSNNKPEQHSISLPTRLSIGDGIIIPLFITQNQLNITDSVQTWNIISKTILLPSIIHYNDNSGSAQKSLPVRKMKDPVQLGEGVEIRG